MNIRSSWCFPCTTSQHRISFRIYLLFCSALLYRGSVNTEVNKERRWVRERAMKRESERQWETKSRHLTRNDSCLCLWWILCECVHPCMRGAVLWLSCLCLWMCVCVIASTALCLCSIWQLQEITGVLVEECTFLPMTLHVLKLHEWKVTSGENQCIK